MKSGRKWLKTTILLFALIVLSAQLVRIEKSNPPGRSMMSGVSVKPVLQRSCFDCHSNETRWPWYSSVAPFSWLVGRDVKEGREHLNFSEWDTYGRGMLSHKLRSIGEEVRSGAMPPWYYLIVHRDCRLNETERQQVLSWVDAALEQEMK